MARHRPRGRSIQVCPQCGSERLIFNAGLITGQVYHCLKCDYIGSLVFERELPPTPSAEPATSPDPPPADDASAGAPAPEPGR